MIRPRQPCAAANPARASRLPSLRPVRRVAELGSLGDIRTHEDIRNYFGISWCRVAGTGFFHRLGRPEFASSGWFFDFSSPDFYALWSVCLHFEFFYLEEQTFE